MAHASTDGGWSEKAAFDFERGEPQAQLGECCERGADIDHGDTETALDVAEVIAEGWLRLEAQLDPVDGVNLEKLEGRELHTLWARLPSESRS